MLDNNYQENKDRKTLEDGLRLSLCYLYLFFTSLVVGRFRPIALPGKPQAGVSARRVWFHAASAGELESLWPVVLEWVRSPGGQVILSVFSSSGESGIARLRDQCERIRAGSVLYAGLSPIEGGWNQALGYFRPERFLTVKYEAWPELWISLYLRKVPLTLLGARVRSSLSWARRICRLLAGGIPELTLLTAVETDNLPLRREFPTARIETVGDPRWDRVFERIQTDLPRVREIVQLNRERSRPWGILAQVWPEDLRQWSAIRVPGTVWVVPHSLKPEVLAEIDTILAGWNTDPIVLREMGLLAELYGEMNWAYVGGGFGRGIHSTLEPAAHGLPILCGPNRTQQFAEVRELQKSGQLQVVHGPEEIQAAVDRIQETATDSQRSSWRGQAEARQGAVLRVLQGLESSAPSRSD